MRKISVFFMLVFLLTGTQSVFAGAVVQQQEMQKQQMMQQKMQQQGMAQPQLNRQPPVAVAQSPQEVSEVTPGQLEAALRKSSRVWPQIIDWEIKELIVKKYIELYGRQGIVIEKPAMHYVSFIDEFSRQDPNMLQYPFDRVLMVVAVMEYDFNNGQDPDTMARSMLGEQAYLANRQRLGILD